MNRLEVVISAAATKSLAAFFSREMEKLVRALVTICKREILKNAAHSHQTRFLHGYFEYRLLFEVQEYIELLVAMPDGVI